MSKFSAIPNSIFHQVKKTKTVGSRLATLMAGASPIVLGAVFNAAMPSEGRPQAVNIGGLTSNNIVADGRTKTKITVTGNHTKIRTDTVSAGVGFNTFSDFQQAAGQRVDLFVPDQAGSLVNIVSNGAVVINGELNSFKDGKIGGNVFFSNSNGFIVGASGRVNVGSLTVNTPTQAFLDRIVGANGAINNAVAQQLMRGEIPISPNGVISIAGKISAEGGITLQGHTVMVNGMTGPLTGDDIGQRVKFGATVNSTGMLEGGALVSRGGQISIVAAGNATIGGRVSANAKINGAGGKVSVKSVGDITVEETAEISADGAGADGAGGEIIFFADTKITTESGASFSAHGAGSGDGGFIEISGKYAKIGGGLYDLGSDWGRAGTLLFDPFDFLIDASDVRITGGANISLVADNSITIASGGVLNSTYGMATAGNILIKAPKITLANGSTVNAGTTGDVTLTATQTSGGTAEIIIGDGTGAAPILHGNDITLTATSTVDNFALLVAAPTATAKVTITSGDIVADGAFNVSATATANGDLSTIPLPIGIVVTNSTASVLVAGTSDITADSVSLTASSTVTSNIPTESLAPANSAGDGAVAVSTINSTAEARILGTAKVVATNAIDVTATNKIISVANATPAAAAFGASVGVSVINAVTTAELAGNANVTAASLNLVASTATDVTVTAIAGAGGATEPSAGSQASSFLSGAKYGDEASTSEGNLSVAGALAISDLTSTTKSSYNTTISATILGDLLVASSSENHTAVTADGTAVSSANGVGVAIGINVAKVKNDAVVATAVSARSIHLSALSDNPLSAKVGNSFTTTSTSGAGASALGFAGSFALNLVDTRTTATIGAGVAVNITAGGSGDVEANTDNKTTSSVTVKPADGGATGSTLGLGASVGLNIIATRSLAEVGDGATVTGASALTLSALATHVITTTAEAGSSGGFSLTPVVALSLVNNTTTARLGTGAAPLTTTGSVSVSAAQSAATTTTAKADAAGAKAAVGASFALAMVDDQVLATTERSVTTGAGGEVTFSAIGGSSSTVEAAASAQGAAAEDDAGDAPAGGAPNVDSAVTSKLTSASGKQKTAGVGSTKQQGATDTSLANGDGRSASTDGSKVSVAAGVAINVQNATVSAVVPTGKVITTAGTLTLRTSSNAVGKATASGAAVGVKDAKGNTPDPAKIGIGAAVAVNAVKVENNATLGLAVHSVGGLAIEALSLDVAKLMASAASTDTASDVFLTSATSGAGAGKVGIAGSLALNLIDTESKASIVNGATVVITGGAAGDVTLTADNRTQTTAEAKPVGGGATGATVGIGASVGLNIVANRSVAEVGNGSILTGAHAVGLTASATHEVTTTAEAGSSGGVSLTPVLALSLVNNTTTARLGTGTILATTGAVSVSAAQTAATTTTARAAAAGTKAAIGASLALALVDDQVLATTDRSINATGAASSVSFSAIGVSSSTLSATATAAGAKEGKDADAAPASSGDSVDKTATTKLTSASTKQEKAKVGSTSQRGATTAEAGNESGRSAKSSEGKVSAAAAVAVNVQKSKVTAFTLDDVNITAGGAFNVASANNTNGSATSDGSAVKGADGGQSQVGIGVAVSVNVVKATNSATIGQGSHRAAGVNVTALQGAGAPSDTIFSQATSGAGGSKVGIAGSLALNIVDVDTIATISGGAVVNATTGTSSIQAEEKMLATAIAAPKDTPTTGGKVGIGASVGLNFITTTTKAELLDGATLTNGAGLTVTATANIDTVTEASAGAAGGIAVDASVSLALLDERTTARVGTGNALTMGAGAVTISAVNTGTNKAKSTGETKAGKVAVGASAALILGSGASDGVLNNTSVTSAGLARDITAGSLAISASSVRTYDANASATAEGGKFNQTDEKKNATTGGTSTTATSIDKTKGSQRGSDGKPGGSKLTVAAAAGIAAAQDNVSATLGDVTLNIGGAVGVSATNQIGMSTSGSGLAANPKSKFGIGIGISLAIINNKTAATVSNGATINGPGSVTINATSRENADGVYPSTPTALAIAGATGKKVAIAGAMAVAISTGETKSSIGNNVTITNGGAVSVKTDNTSHLASKALAGAAGLSGTGIGASIAVVVADKDYTASVGTGSNIRASGLSVRALNHKIDSPTLFDFTDLADLKTKLTTGQLLGDNNYYVEAIGGSAGSKTSITGSFAVMVFNDDISATVGSGAINARNNNLTIQADNKFLAKALSGAISLSGGTGVGVAGSVIVSSGTTISKLDANAVVTDARNFTNSAAASQDIQVFGVSVAAAANNAVNGVATVITSNNRVEALMAAGARVTATGAVNLTAENDFSTFSLAGGAGGGGSNGVGAAASVVAVENVTRAAMAASASANGRTEINTNGAIDISARATETGTTIAAAGAAGGSNAVGAGVAVYVLDTTTEALVGQFAKVGNTYTAGSFDLTASDVTTLLSVGGAASGGGSAGAGAGVGVGVIGKNTAAKLGNWTTVNSGNVVVGAESVEALSAITVGVGIGGSAGLAGAVAAYAVTTDTTAEIGNYANVRANGNVAVLAADKTTIDMLEGAIAGGGSAGIGASVGVTVINATTLAKIDDHARVTALGNGTAQQYVTGFKPKFEAYVGSGSFDTADIGTTDAAGAGANAAKLRTSDDARKAGLELLTKNRKIDPVHKTARGVIVNAAGISAVRSMAVAGTAAGSVAVSISASVPVITTNTQSIIGAHALINKMAGSAGATQSVAVAAASDIYTLGFSGAVAIGGSVGGGAGVNVAIVDQMTIAKAGGGMSGIGAGQSNIVAMDDVSVSAKSTEDFAIWAIAGAGGGVAALAGSGSALDMTSVTTAELGGFVVAQGNVDVVADDQTRTALMAGSVAIGGTAGVGAAVGVILLDKTVTASIVSYADVSAYGRNGTRNVHTGSRFDTQVSASGVNVEANSTQAALTLVVSGAGGLYAGIAGVLALDLMDVTTTAFVGSYARVNENNATGSSSQDVAITARDSTVTDVAAGAISGGLVGLSGAVDVGIFKATTSAYVEDGASVTAKRDVHVNGLSNKAGTSLVASGSGGVFALAAGIAIYSYGDGVGVNSDANTELSESSDGVADIDGINSDAQDQVNNSQVDDLLKSSDDARITKISSDAQAKRGGINVAGAASSLSVPGGTSAIIGNTVITAGRNVGVTSSDALDVSLTTGGFAVGGGAVGAGVGVLTVDTGSSAQIIGSGATVTAGGVNVKAYTNHLLKGRSYAGAAGASIAVSADAAVFKDKSRTSALIQVGTLVVSGGVNVNADAKREIDLVGVGVSVSGLAGVGASIATAEISGTVTALINNTTIGSEGVRATSTTVTAKSDDKAVAKATAAGGGVGVALQGAGSTATVKPIVTAILSNSNVYTSSAVTISAEAIARAETEATGFAVAGILAAGGSIAESTVGAQVAASITGASIVDAGSINVLARLTTPLVKAASTGSAGALVGLSATISKAKTNSTAIALVSGATLKAIGLVNLDVQSSTNQDADASGLAVGFVAAGFNKATAQSDIKTHATLSNLVSLNAGSLSINANGVDQNTADTEAGSGGLVAGSAASGTTITNSDTLASANQTTGSYSIVVSGDATVAAAHQTNFAGSVDSTQASLAGGSGAELYHTVNSAVDANLGDGVNLYAANLTMRALNNTTNNFSGWNVSSSSGGLASLPAGGATVNIAHSKTNASIGAGSLVHLLPTNGVSLSLLTMTANSNIVSKQKVKIDSGGAIALADADIATGVVANATAVIGANTDVIVDKGDIQIAAWGTADIENRASATTYGLAGAPSGDVKVTYVGDNTVEIGQNVRLEATNGISPVDGSKPSNASIKLVAGRDLAGTVGGELEGGPARLNFNAVLDIFNKTAIPIPSSPNPVVRVTNLSKVEVKDSGATVRKGVNAAGDIYIVSTGGDITASAVGTGKDIYREALAEIASAVSNAFGGGDVTFDYHGGTTAVTNTGTVNVDGLVDTGLQRFKTVQIKYSNVDFQQTVYDVTTCTVTATACIAEPLITDNIAITVTGDKPVGTQIFARLDELKALMAEYGEDVIAQGAYANEIKFLQDKLVSLGLGFYNLSTGDFVEGDYTGKSPKEAARILVDIDNQNIATANVEFGLELANVFDGTVASPAQTVQVQYNAATVGVDTNLTSGLNSVKSYSTYSVALLANPTPTPAITAENNLITAHNNENIARANAITILIQEGQNAANQVAGLKISNVTAQADINTQRVALISAEASLAAAIAVGIPANITAARLAIANAKTSITTNLDTIKTNNTNMATKTQTAINKANSAKANINTLASLLASYTSGAEQTTITNATAVLNAAGPNTTSLAGYGSLNLATNAIGRISTQKADIVASSAIISTRITALKAAATGTATAATATSLADFEQILTGLNTSLGNHTNTFNSASNSVTGPMQPEVIVPDVVARLGNIFVTADNLTGSGKLAAPGDARILVENFTAASLVLNNLVTPTYDAANVRFNGALVNSAADINALNKALTVGASFDVKTGLVSSRPLVEILSHYNPEDPSFHNTSSSLQHLKANYVAPDIIINTDKVLENTTGAVRIISDAGNIYVRGKINAGSIEIVAKNGDFVASYVNGFNHIGGDPAQFNDPTRFAEAGPGILANGGISIAARYLNINSTIQSGIVDLRLDLATADKLTTVAVENIGLTTTAVAAKITTYRAALVGASAPSATINITNSFGQVINIVMPTGGIAAADLTAAIDDYTRAVVKNPNKDPLYSFTVGTTFKQINIKDWIDGSITGQIQFTRLQAEDFIDSAHATGEGLYQVISPTSTIGANYNAVDKVFEVNGASVHGGYIQLYGQVMNTAEGAGALKILDGFGTIDINNTTDKAVVLRTLNTGSDKKTTVFNDQSTSSLRGTAGIIDITDVTGFTATGDNANPLRVNVKHTVYSRDYDPNGSAAGQVRIAQIDGYIDPISGRIIKNSGGFETNVDLVSALANTGGNRTASYSTTDNQRYVWTTAVEKRTKTTKTNESSGAFFSLINYANSSFYAGSTTNVLGTSRLSDGTYATINNTQVANNLTVQTLQGLNVTDTVYAEIPNADIDTVKLYESSYANITSDTGIYEESRSHTCSVACWIQKTTYINSARVQEYTVVTTHSLKADYAIAIEFIGADTGSITVDSVGDVVLTSGVKSLGGDVTINVTGANKSIIKGTDFGLITAQSVSLNATGSVGGLDYLNAGAQVLSKSIFVNMTKSDSGTQGTLNAVAGNGNVSVFGRGDLRVGQITAASSSYSKTTGNVELSALGSISAASTASLVQGYNVTLSAVSGSIGATPAYSEGGWSTADYESLLHVNSGYTADAALRPFGAAPANADLGLTAIAAGDIGIRSATWDGNTDGSSSDGTMLINQVLSLGGNVTLASTGQILDNNPVESIDTRTYNKLVGYWDSLGLLKEETARTVVDDNGVIVRDKAGNPIVVQAIGNSNDIKQKEAITAFENIKTKQYNQYWKIRETQADPRVFDPSFTVTPTAERLKSLESYYTSQEVDAIRAQFLTDNPTISAANLLDTGNTAFDAARATIQSSVVANQTLIETNVALEVTEYSLQKTAEYHALNDLVGGQQGNTFLAEYDASTFEFTATKQQRADQEALYRVGYEATFRTQAETAYRAQVLAEFPNYTTAELDLAVQTGVNAATAQELAKPSTEYYTDLTTFVDAYESQQTATIKAGLSTNDDLANLYIADYEYTASSTEKTALTAGSIWTQRELAFAIAPGALKTVTGTNPVIKDPNVSGRTVTILANKGIGETATDSDTGNRGVSIRSSLDPALLTTDQKVALAAAERTDLLLTIEGVALPTGSRAKQIAAFAVYAAAVPAASHGATVEIPLGAKLSELSAIKRATLTAAAAGLVTKEKTVLTILSKRPLNFNAADELNIRVTDAPESPIDITSDIGKAFLASRSGALLGAITTSGETRIKVRNDILASSGGSSISTGNLILEASQGRIGGATDPLQLALRPGATTTARAQNGVNLEFAAGGAIDTVYSPQDIKLNALNGDLTNANRDLLINVLGNQVELAAVNGSIGETNYSLNVGVNIDGGIKANAKDEINLLGTERIKFIIKEAKSTGGGAITLLAVEESVIDGVVETAGQINLVAGGHQILTGNGKVTSGANGVSINAGALKMMNGSTLDAAGKAGIITVGDALVTGIKTASTDLDAANISAGGRVFAGTLAARAYDISAIAAGAGVKIVAGLGIGDKTKTNEVPGVNTITNMANPLRILTNELEAMATNGSTNAAALSDIKLSSLTATLGGIAITGAGTMDIVNATSGGSQSFAAQGDVKFTQLSANSLPKDVGNISVTSANGSVIGGDITASGSTNTEGNGVTFGTIMAGINSTIISTGDITGNTQIAVGDITDTALSDIKLSSLTATLGGIVITGAGTMDIVNANSGGSQSFAAQGDVKFTQLSANGLPKDVGNISVTSTNGSVIGGDITASGSTNTEGNGVTFGTIMAGINSTIISTGDITGDTQIAVGDITDTAGKGGLPGSLNIRVIGGRNLYLQATKELNLQDARVAETIELHADKTVAKVTQTPSGPNPLNLSATGAENTIGTSADLTVDAPAGIIVEDLKVVDTKLGTRATRIEIEKAFVPGSLLLTSPIQTVKVDNRTPLPKSGNNVRVYVPKFGFELTLDGNATGTNGIVVSYDETSRLTDILPTALDGISLIRDTVRNILEADDPRIQSFGSVNLNTEDNLDLTQFDGRIVEIDNVEYMFFVRGTGPAVLLAVK